MMELTLLLDHRGLKFNRKTIPLYFSFWVNFLHPMTEQNFDSSENTEKGHQPILEGEGMVGKA